MYVSTAMRAQLRKPGACGVFSLQVKYDPASELLAWNVPQNLILLMTFSIAGSLVMMSTNLEQYKSCLLIHIKWSKQRHPSQIDKTTLIKNLLDFSRSRDQRPPGSLLHKRKEPGNEVALALGAASSNHLRVEAHLPKASILDWGNRRITNLMTLGSVQWLELFEEGAHNAILWSDDPSGGRSCGVLTI
jgi:hypothetical protein